jgi:hypothetical protein
VQAQGWLRSEYHWCKVNAEIASPSWNRFLSYSSLSFTALLIQHLQIIWEGTWGFHQILMLFRFVYWLCILYNKNSIFHVIWGTAWTVHFMFLNFVRWPIACSRKRLWSSLIETLFF